MQEIKDFNKDVLDNSEYELNDNFINATMDDYRDDKIINLDEIIQNWNENNSDILFSDSNGIYIPKLFSDMLLNEYFYRELNNKFIFETYNSNNELLATFSNIDKEDLITLSENDQKSCDFYYDIWDDILSNCCLQYDNKEWHLEQDGDLWIRTNNFIDITI